MGHQNFESEVLRSTEPVLVAFGASWSRPCQVIEGVLDEVAVACAGRAKVMALDADDNPGLSLWYEIQTIPALLFFVAGTVRARLIGTATKEAILRELRSVLDAGSGAAGPASGSEPTR